MLSCSKVGNLVGYVGIPKTRKGHKINCTSKKVMDSQSSFYGNMAGVVIDVSTEIQPVRYIHLEQSTAHGRYIWTHTTRPDCQTDTSKILGQRL